MPRRAAYLDLLEAGELDRRVDALASMLTACRVCPCGCGVDRTAGEMGACRVGSEPLVASWCRHMGEEPPITGTRGSGTVFFARCNLRCVFCQNHQISQGAPDASQEYTVDQLAEAMLALQGQGCHNINLVSPSHAVPPAIAAVAQAARGGLALPLVYNTNGYDAPDTLRLLDGVVDIYLPDLKYADEEAGRELSGVADYPLHARAAIAEMWRQVGPPELDGDGVARRGVLVRHLILPNGLADSEDSLEWLRETCGSDVGLSLMAQYYPTHLASDHPLLGRRVSWREYQRVVDRAIELGFTNLLIQDHREAPGHYQPDFTQDHPFEH